MWVVVRRWPAGSDLRIDLGNGVSELNPKFLFGSSLAFTVVHAPPYKLLVTSVMPRPAEKQVWRSGFRGVEGRGRTPVVFVRARASAMSRKGKSSWSGDTRQLCAAGTCTLVVSLPYW